MFERYLQLIEVDVVDPQVDGRHLVAGGPAGALPLHHLGQPAPQAVVGGEEGLPVRPRRVELGVVGAARPGGRPRRSQLSGERLCMTGVRERTASSMSAKPSMPSPVPSSVTVVRSLGTDESFHARASAGRLVARRPPELRRDRCTGVDEEPGEGATR